MKTEVTGTLSTSLVPSPTPQSLTGPANLVAKTQRDNRKISSATPAFLSNLGRATLRGIRKCPQCGVYNGTRGLSCKNKACGVSLRNASAAGGKRKKCAVEVVKVIIDRIQVFSVCHRGRGSTGTQMGFVELVPTDTAIATGDGATLLTRINLGRCFLPSCRQGQSLCVHIRQAIECENSATPLTLKSSVLEGLQISIQAREELWRLATESPGPLVQRISNNTLVVKCHTDSQHPLGLLHLTVGAGGLCGATALQSASTSLQPCLHFYACVCAFASDEKLAAEFAPFISYTPSGVQLTVTSEKFLQTEASSSLHKGKKFRLDESLPAGSQAMYERTVTLDFQQWLAGVTERIHQTMHYQSDGKPQSLVYHIPQEFFNALQHRLSLGSKKRRLPNFTTAFVRKDGLPLGTFSKYTWHITNVMQVKRIFDTPEVPLELHQSFVKNTDGSYSRFQCPEPQIEPEGNRSDRPQAIRPMELRTFLKVGTAEQNEAGPFVIEWIPDLLPRCQMGELRITFEFGHREGRSVGPLREDEWN
uniref:Chromosome 2 open reading frame 42 n=1 Tax=Cynoglossus semilaevis TaxID=244447 RepID=A0A3P8WA09_CYNSE